MLSRVTNNVIELLEDLTSRTPETLTDAVVLLLTNITAQARGVDWAAPDLTLLTSLLREDVVEETRIPRVKSFDAGSVKVTQRARFELKGLRIRCAVLDTYVSKNGLMYVGTEEGRVCCISLMDGSIVNEYFGHVYAVTCISVTQYRSTRLLITGSVDKTLRMHRLDKNNAGLQCVFAEHKGVITGVQCDPAIGCIFTTSFDRQMLSWTFRHGLCDGVAFVAPTPIHSMVASGSRIMLGCRSGEVFLLTIENKKAFFEHCFAREPSAIEWNTLKESDLIRYKGYIQQHRVTWGGHATPVWCLAESQNFLFSGGDNGMIIQWDLVAKARVRSYHDHVDRVASIHVTREGLLISSSYDATIVISNTGDGEAMIIERPHYHSITAVLVGNLPHAAGVSKMNLAMPAELFGPVSSMRVVPSVVAPPPTPPMAPDMHTEETISSWNDNPINQSQGDDTGPIADRGRSAPPPEKPLAVIQLVSVSLDKSITILDVTTNGV